MRKPVLYRHIPAIFGFVFGMNFGGFTASAQSYTCDFYRDQLEPAYHCGSRGYPLAYGNRYCEKIRSLTGLSEDGKRWRDATAVCLQDALAPAMESRIGNCKALRQFAFLTHRDCYTRNGVISICDLPLSDVSQLARAIDTNTLISFKSLVLILQVAQDCPSTRTHFRTWP